MSTNRREFLSVLSLTALAADLRAQSASGPAKRVVCKAEPFSLSEVRLLDGPFKESQELNRRFLHKLPPDRLLHNFRVNAGIPSTAQPLGGWEKPDCELRGHFVGHYLSACAFMSASAGDQELKDRAAYVVAELAKCQKASGNGYLSAFPIEFFDRLNARRKVWAPFYTIHKIMAGLLDVNQICGNAQALQVLEGMAEWAGDWSSPLSYAHMQDVLDTEFGGMAETLFNLQAVTGNRQYGDTAVRFEKARFLDPLAGRRDELKGLHVNTHVPQVIGAARRYEVMGDRRSHDIADYFWTEVTSARCYCTGGTSNNEAWLTAPGKLAEELPLSTDTEECCVAYNMLKLTRHLYQWTADARYFDFYERTLFNHRLGTLNPETGSGMYYMPLHANATKVFGSEFESFWCCTGTGVEEHAKLNDSIYFHDADGVFVNLFIPSEVTWIPKNIRVRQETKFPDERRTRLTIHTERPAMMTLRIRVPAWIASGGEARVNGKVTEAFADGGSYLTIARTWKDGDQIEINLPMSLRQEALPDDPNMFAVLYGPIVLAGQLGPSASAAVNGTEPVLKQDPKQFRTLNYDSIQSVAGQPLTYRSGDVTLSPLNRTFNQHYAVYWRLT